MRLTLQTTLAAFATVAACAAFAPAHATVVFLNPTKKDGLPTSAPVPTLFRMAPGADHAGFPGPGAADFPTASEADFPAGDDRRDADAPPSFAEDEAPVLAAMLTVTPESGGDGALGYNGDAELPVTLPEPAQRVPEPATLALAMAALALMTGVQRRRQLARTRR
ncbi:MAG: PEP-CTERM sorting domain-containing protein [Rubrivivax sp.]